MKSTVLTLTASILSACCLQAPSENISVRIQTLDKSVRIGTITGKGTGCVEFRSGDGAPIQIPDTQLAYIQFPLNETDMKQIQRFLDNGQYKQASELLNRLLTPCMPYIGLPSNMLPRFLQWMAASYWAGDYARTIGLSDALVRFPGEFHNQSLFYAGLAQLAQGNFQPAESLLQTDEGNMVYPPQSAARFYITARILQKKQQYIPAIRTAAQMIALHSRDADWMPQAELLCEELYLQMDMPESAKAVQDDIREFYPDPDMKKRAAAIFAANRKPEK
jgi:hypothetical protein